MKTNDGNQTLILSKKNWKLFWYYISNNLKWNEQAEDSSDKFKAVIGQM